MKATSSVQVFEEIYDASEEELMSLVEIETMERFLDYDDEPMYCFKGIIVGGFFSLLLWAIIFLVIT